MPTANSAPESQATADLQDMTGLDIMRNVQQGRLPPPPISRTMNYRMHQVDDGQVVFRGIPQADHTNPMGTVHGGWYGTLLDSCMACAVVTKLPKGAAYTTLEYKINILRPIPLGMEIDAIGITDHVGRSTGIAHGEIRGVKDGKLYATGSTTCIVLTAK